MLNHKSYKNSVGIFLVWSMTVFGRNPFEFADQELKKYTTAKIQTTHKKLPTEKQRSSGWEIVKVSNNSTRIVKDGKGNVRSISLSDEK